MSKMKNSYALAFFSIPLLSPQAHAITSTWIEGQPYNSQPGVYGTLKTPSTSHIPGSRSAAATSSGAGNIWIFGGFGDDSNGMPNFLNDLWKFNPSDETWTWVSGSYTGKHSGVYGMQGVASSTNEPGSRDYSSSWTDQNGNFWLFGGFGYDANESSTRPNTLNDLWQYNATADQWTWMSGASRANAVGTYGTQGQPSSTNTPGARQYSTSATDSHGNLWLFGGYGNARLTTKGYLNDLWVYNTSTNAWTWVSGANSLNAIPHYGVQGTPDSANVPGAREFASSWFDSNGNFWIFGGFGEDSNGNFGALNDLWEYNPTAGTWVWIHGSSVANQTGHSGTQGSPSPLNQPETRYAAVTWQDTNGHIWMLGGYGIDSFYNVGILQDLWQYDPTSNQWTWYAGSNQQDQGGVWGSRGVTDPSNLISSRELSSAFTDGNGNLWLFGGSGYDANGNFGYLNDLWEITH